MVEQHKEERQEEKERVAELKLYILVQEEYYADQMLESALQTTEMHMEYTQQRAKLEFEKSELTRKVKVLEAKYEEKRLVLLVAEAKLMSDQGLVNARLVEMRKELATMQYPVSMGEDKVQQILMAHKHRNQQLVVESLAKGWGHSRLKQLNYNFSMLKKKIERSKAHGSLRWMTTPSLPSRKAWCAMYMTLL